MNLPTYEDFMLPALQCLSNYDNIDKKTICANVAKMTNLTKQQMDDILPSQTMPTYINRISWALTYLKKAGLVESPTRAVYKITNEGKNVLNKSPKKIDNEFLSQYNSFIEFKNKIGNKKIRLINYLTPLQMKLYNTIMR